VVQPVKGFSLASFPGAVKRAAGPGGAAKPRQSRLVGAISRIEPIKKTRVAEEIADRVRELIQDGTFKPGRALPSERVLAERFRDSGGTIRDGFRILEMIGLLETRHGQGTFPHELTLDRLVMPLASLLTSRRDLQEELMDVRRMFEPAVARVAATRVTDEDLVSLTRILEAQRRQIKAGRSAIREDTAYHAALARATRNEIVERIMETLNYLLMESRKLTLKQQGRPERSIRGHEAVVAALSRRDADAAARAMHEHIDQIADLLSTAKTSLKV
jgi:GntR family transcriptional repressor for pyruvate dehydrogenase complex